jgi:hypothetical protein
VSDIDTVVVDSLKALDPQWPIREADIARAPLTSLTSKEMSVPSNVSRERPDRRPVLFEHIYRLALGPDHQCKRSLRRFGDGARDSVEMMRVATASLRVILERRSLAPPSVMNISSTGRPRTRATTERLLLPLVEIGRGTAIKVAH